MGFAISSYGVPERHVLLLEAMAVPTNEPIKLGKLMDWNDGRICARHQVISLRSAEFPTQTTHRQMKDAKPQNSSSYQEK
jgi:hypothetical protein